jgi:hypothetical protein
MVVVVVGSGSGGGVFARAHNSVLGLRRSLSRPHLVAQHLYPFLTGSSHYVLPVYLLVVPTYRTYLGMQLLYLSISEVEG